MCVNEKAHIARVRRVRGLFEADSAPIRCLQTREWSTTSARRQVLDRKVVVSIRIGAHECQT